MMGRSEAPKRSKAFAMPSCNPGWVAAEHAYGAALLHVVGMLRCRWAAAAFVQRVANAGL